MHTINSEQANIRRKTAVFTYFGLLAAAMFLAMPDPRAIVVAYMFPFGIAMLFHTPNEGTGTLLPAAGYIIYALFLVLFSTVQRRPRFYLLCVVFVLFLLLNVAGCHKMLEGFGSVT